MLFAPIIKLLTLGLALGSGPGDQAADVPRSALPTHLPSPVSRVTQWHFISSLSLCPKSSQLWRHLLFLSKLGANNLHRTWGICKHRDLKFIWITVFICLPINHLIILKWAKALQNNWWRWKERLRLMTRIRCIKYLRLLCQNTGSWCHVGAINSLQFLTYVKCFYDMNLF